MFGWWIVNREQRHIASRKREKYAQNYITADTMVVESQYTSSKLSLFEGVGGWWFLKRALIKKKRCKTT